MVDEQTASMEVWERIAQDPNLELANDPRFAFALHCATSEIEAGQTIEMKRPEQQGQRIIFPYSLFWQIVEVIHAEREQIRR